MAELEFTWTSPDPLHDKAKTESEYLAEFYRATQKKEIEAGLNPSTFVNASEGEKFKSLSINQLKNALSNPFLLDYYNYKSIEEILGRPWHALEKDNRTGKEKWCYHILNDFRVVLNKLIAIPWFEKFSITPTINILPYTSTGEKQWTLPHGSYIWPPYSNRIPFPSTNFDGDMGIWTYNGEFWAYIQWTNYSRRTCLVQLALAGAHRIENQLYFQHNGEIEIGPSDGWGGSGGTGYARNWVTYNFDFFSNFPNGRYYLEPTSYIYWKATVPQLEISQMYPGIVPFRARIRIRFTIEGLRTRWLDYGVGSEPGAGFTLSVEEFTSIEQNGRNLWDDYKTLYPTELRGMIRNLEIFFEGYTGMSSEHDMRGCGRTVLEGTMDNLKLTNLKKVVW